VLFGPASEKSMIDYQPASESDKVIDVEAETKSGEETEVEPDKKPPEKPEEKEEVFEKLDVKEQIEHLKQLMKKKGYTETKLKSPLDKFSETQRGMFLDHLKGMPDAEELPFE